MIISLRGTHGSGKSTIIRLLMARGKVTPTYGALGPITPEAYSLLFPHSAAPTFVLGPYLTECGGCDRIQPYDLISDLIEKYAERGHVLFEGALVSATYGRIGKLMERWRRSSAFVFLDTPVQECLTRIERRRGRSRDERLVLNVKQKFASVLSVKQRVERDGIMAVQTVSCADAAALLLKLSAR